MGKLQRINSCSSLQKYW